MCRANQTDSSPRCKTQLEDPISLHCIPWKYFAAMMTQGDTHTSAWECYDARQLARHLYSPEGVLHNSSPLSRLPFRPASLADFKRRFPALSPPRRTRTKTTRAARSRPDFIEPLHRSLLNATQEGTDRAFERVLGDAQQLTAPRRPLTTTTLSDVYNHLVRRYPRATER